MIGPEYRALQQCDTVSLENNTMPYIKSLHSCLNRVKGDGYTTSFEKTLSGIHSNDVDRDYLPNDFKVVNFFRFEGNDEIADNVVMFMIETTDGLKGTLVKPYRTSVGKKREEWGGQEQYSL